RGCSLRRSHSCTGSRPCHRPMQPHRKATLTSTGSRAIGGIDIPNHDRREATAGGKAIGRSHGTRQHLATGVRSEAVNLAPREIDKLLVYVVADLARKRMARGTKLNYSEAVALVTEAILEGARDGKTVPECMEIGTKVLTREQVMQGVPE